MRRAAVMFAVAVVLAAPGVSTAAGRTLPCIPLDAVDGRCERWSAAEDGNGGFDAVRTMTTSPNGQVVFVAGETDTDDGIRIAITAYDAGDGVRRWTTVHGRPGDAYDSAAAIVAAPDGSKVFVAGGACVVINDPSTCDALLVARDAATGAASWSLTRDGAGSGLDSAQDVILSSSGDVVYIGGQTLVSGSSDEDYLVAAFDADTGEELWSARYDGPAHGFDRGADLVRAGDMIILTGRSVAAGGDTDIVTVAFDTREDREGEIRWVAGTGGSGNQEPFGMDVDDAGRRIVVAGDGTGATPGKRPVVAAIDATSGDVLWSTTFADPGVAGGTFYDVAISPDGSRAVATGYTQRSDGKGPSTVGYDAASGQKLWAVNSQEGLSYVVDISPDGRRTYVTGSSYSRRGSMHNTISYVTDTGVQRWGALYEETAPPAHLNNTVLYPTAMVLSPDGTDVYVGGMTRAWFAEQDDALTLAYQA